MMLVRKYVFLGLALQMLLVRDPAFSQSNARLTGHVPGEIIVTLEGPGQTSEGSLLNKSAIRRALRGIYADGANPRFRYLYPEFCSLARSHREDVQAQHLKLISRALERDSGISDTRFNNIQRYLKRPIMADLCRSLIVETDGRDPQDFATAVNGRALKGGYKISNSQPNYTYQLSKDILMSLLSTAQRPASAVGVISSSGLSKAFVGRRSFNIAEVSGNGRDDDSNGYIDDIFGIRRGGVGIVGSKALAQENDAAGYVILEVAEDKGDSIEFTTEYAAQALLYALHRGVTSIFLPFEKSDLILTHLAGRINLSGATVDHDVYVTRSLALGVGNQSANSALYGEVTLPGPQRILGYAVVLYGDDSYETALLDTFHLPPGKATYYFPKLRGGSSARLVIAMDGAAFTSNGKAEVPLIPERLPEYAVNFSGTWLPAKWYTLGFKALDGLGKPFPGIRVSGFPLGGFNIFPGEMRYRNSYADLDGLAELKMRVGSLYLLDYPARDQMSHFTRVYGVVTADKLRTQKFDASASAVNICYKVVDSEGKPVAGDIFPNGVVTLYANGLYKRLQVKNYQVSFNSPGQNGKNCFTSDIETSAEYRLTYSVRRETQGEVVVGKISQSKTVTIVTGAQVATPTPTIVATPVHTPTPTPTNTPQTVPTTAPTSTPTPTRTPTRTPTLTPTLSQTRTPTPTPTPPTSNEWVQVTVSGQLTKGGEPNPFAGIIRYKNKTTGVERDLTWVTGSGSFSRRIMVRFGDVLTFAADDRYCTSKPASITRTVTSRTISDLKFALTCKNPFK